MSTPGPGGRNHAAVRTVLRVVGLVLLGVGLFLVITGFTAGSSAPLDVMDDSAPDGFLRFGLGGFMTVIGFGMTAAGFSGALARYGAGEQAPVLKDTAHYLSDGDGVLGVGRTRSDAATTAAGPTATGPYCRQCGTRNDDSARFCDSCGTSLA